MTYKKLSTDELKELYRNLQGYFRDNQNTELINLVDKYFDNASSVLVVVDSEYNDNTYDNHFSGVVYVYDSKDLEIPLTREDREAFSTELRGVNLNIPYETNDQMEDFVVYVNKKLPEVYIKVK